MLQEYMYMYTKSRFYLAFIQKEFTINPFPKKEVIALYNLRYFNNYQNAGRWQWSC